MISLPLILNLPANNLSGLQTTILQPDPDYQRSSSEKHTLILALGGSPLAALAFVQTLAR
jgi:hypothetical protein